MTLLAPYYIGTGNKLNKLNMRLPSTCPNLALTVLVGLQPTVIASRAPHLLLKRTCSSSAPAPQAHLLLKRTCSSSAPAPQAHLLLKRVHDSKNRGRASPVKTVLATRGPAGPCGALQVQPTLTSLALCARCTCHAILMLIELSYYARVARRAPSIFDITLTRTENPWPRAPG